MGDIFYITTPIYYVNSNPHIGHAYTTIAADVLRRYRRLFGQDTYFLTGTDEHGQKIVESAAKSGIEPQEFANRISKKFLEMWPHLHIEHDKFIRTTDFEHKSCVQKILQKIFDQGEIFLKEYEGLYCVGCERFMDESELENGNCPDHQNPPEFYKEKNYFFRMSIYQEWLLRELEENKEWIYPERYRNELIQFLQSPLQDLCISRPKSRLEWGIELPFDKNYVTYVWFDALLNYITAIGYNSNEKQFKKYWPADIHLMAKDILTTHCVYWPTMLMACNIPLPKTIFSHGWWLIEKQKMSKSIGNVIKPLDLADEYGVDALRYYLMRNMVLGQDSSFSLDSFVERYNSDLANDYGNLVNRIFMLLDKFFNGKIPEPGDYNTTDLNLIAQTKSSTKLIITNFDNLKIHDAIENSISIFRSINKFLEIKEPWKTAKINNNPKSDSATTLYLCIEIMRIGTTLLFPIMPTKTQDILDSLNLKDNFDTKFGMLKHGNSIKSIKNIFPRIIL